MNKEIEKTLMNGDYESAYRLIQEYRSQKYDYDTFSYLSYYYTGIGKYDKAYDVSCEAVDINPFSIDSCYNLASAAWQLEKYDEAYKYLLRVHYLQEYYKNYVVDNDLVKTQIEELEAIAANDEELSEKYAAIKELEVYSERNPYKSANTPIVGQFMHEGYVTAKIGGNDAVTPVSGYNRGIDRFLYQYISQGYTAKDVVTDVIEHMRTFSGDDQYLWVDFVDLHDISGGFMRSIGVQAQMPLECRMFDNDVKTTVKQTYSENRKYIFEQELREFDFHLGRLFKYIEDNYSDDEIVISLFSDHGAAFMVDNGEPFVSWQRMNVPMMIRGTGGIRGVCDEVVESADYAAMMCALAGIKYDYTGTDANLPKVLGGTREREYALSQSLFVGDLYSGALHGRDFHYYFKSAKPVQPEFRIDISKAEDYIADDRGEIIDDDDRRLKYRERLLSEIKHLIKK